MTINLENIKLDESLVGDLRDKTQKEPYKFEDLNLDGRLKIVLSSLSEDNAAHRKIKVQIENFQSTKKFDDVDEIPKILIDTIFGNTDSLAGNLKKEEAVFLSISDLTLTQKIVLAGLEYKKLDPIVEFQNLSSKKSERFGEMVDDFYTRGGESLKALLATTGNTKIIRSHSIKPPITPTSSRKSSHEEGL